jgi:hypothetical protein
MLVVVLAARWTDHDDEGRLDVIKSWGHTVWSVGKGSEHSLAGATQRPSHVYTWPNGRVHIDADFKSNLSGLVATLQSLNLARFSSIQFCLDDRRCNGGYFRDQYGMHMLSEGGLCERLCSLHPVSTVVLPLTKRTEGTGLMYEEFILEKAPPHTYPYDTKDSRANSKKIIITEEQKRRDFFDYTSMIRRAGKGHRLEESSANININIPFIIMNLKPVVSL